MFFDRKNVDHWLPLQPLAHGVRISLDLKVAAIALSGREVVSKFSFELNETHAVALGVSVAIVAGAPHATTPSLFALSPDLMTPGYWGVATDDNLQHVSSSDALKLNINGIDRAVEFAAKLAFHCRHEDMTGRFVSRLEVGRKHTLDKPRGCRKVDDDGFLRE